MKITKRILAFLMVVLMAFSATIAVSAATKATSLKLNATTINWIVGKSGSFKPTITPSTASKTLSWSSSNTSVATVSSAGKLTAKAPGTATITCKTTDGSNLKATCKVTVGKAVTSVKLNATTITWPVGKSGSFKPTVSPSDAMNKSLSWTSSNTAVATVSAEGKLTAKKAGTATITCTAKDGSGKYATCKVTVTGGNLATSLKLNTNSIKWTEGKSGSFKPTVTPSTASKTLSWTSSNTSVATVSSSGKLTAVGGGTATITCKTTDGSNLKATCTVTVTPLAKTLKLNTNSIRWAAGKSGSFKPTVTPSTASKTLSWTSSNTSVATVSSSGKLTAVAAGTATITCKTTDGSNLKATCTVTVIKSYDNAPNFNKVNEKYFSKGVFTIQGKMTTVVDGEKIELPFMIAENGSKEYIKAEYSFAGFKVQILVKNNKTYLLIPSLRAYQSVDEDIFGGSGFEGLTDIKEFVSTANIKIGNKTYVREELKGKDGSTTFFYFYGGELEIIKFRTADGESIFYVDSIKATVSESDFSIPSGYNEI